jgi:predicted amidohydrolase YtcJ
VRIIYNARIRTLNSNAPFASALAIQDGKIIAAGNDGEILAIGKSGATLENLEGSVVWPGLTDAHMHLEYYAATLNLVDCETATQEEALHHVGERARLTPKGKWLLGHGWNQNLWTEGFGTAQKLDSVASQVPVYLTAKSWHAAWVNSPALQMAGITAETPDPPGGIIQRDPNGAPTGILLEAAMDLVDQIIPQPALDEVCQRILTAQSRLWEFGLTGIHDFDGARCFTALQQLQERGQLKLRVVKAIQMVDMQNAIGVGLRSGFGNESLRIGSVKCFSDGALGPHTAAMLDPYEGEFGNTGTLFMTEDEIFETGRSAVDHGLSLAVHAIGDRANRAALDAFTRLRDYEKSHNLRPLRHRIEHVQLLHPQDYNRLSALGIIASVQPLHATSDMLMADRYWGKRSAGAYAYRTLASSGAQMAFGSDAPVESPNPFLGLHAAVTRRRADGQPGLNGWYPEQRLSLDEALARFTVGPAYASCQERTLGRLAPGHFADLIVLDRDPFHLPPAEILNARPIASMIGGEWVWERKR